MPGYLGNFPNTYRYLRWVFFLKILEISQMPGYLGNFPNAWVSGKFPKCLGFYEISQVPRHFKNFHNLKKIPPLGIWETSQMPGYLGNFPDTQIFGKFPRYPGIWGISQIPILLKNVNAVVTVSLQGMTIMGYLREQVIPQVRIRLRSMLDSEIQNTKVLIFILRFYYFSTQSSIK